MCRLNTASCGHFNQFETIVGILCGFFSADSAVAPSWRFIPSEYQLKWASGFNRNANAERNWIRANLQQRTSPVVAFLSLSLPSPFPSFFLFPLLWLADARAPPPAHFLARNELVLARLRIIWIIPRVWRGVWDELGEKSVWVFGAINRLTGSRVPMRREY